MRAAYLVRERTLIDAHQIHITGKLQGRKCMWKSVAVNVLGNMY